MEQKVVVKTRKAKQKLWCQESKQETGSRGQESLFLENRALYGGVDGNGSSGPTIVLRNTLHPRTSLVVQRLRLQAPNAGGLGMIPGQVTRSCMRQLRACMPQVKDPTRRNEDPACGN